jgi:hypothetical protein
LILEDSSVHVYLPPRVSKILEKGNMRRKIISGMSLALIVLSLSMLAFNIRPANANGLIGDLNDDGVVNMEDLIIAFQAFGSTPGHPRWNAKADITGNGKVDLTDIYIIAKNFGDTA